MTLVSLPSYTGYLNSQFLIEPLSGPKNPQLYTDRFPDELYHKTPESHLIRFLFAILGPAGVGDIRKQTFDARVYLEAGQFELFDLDAFYGNPFAFGRIFDEFYPESFGTTLDAELVEIIRAKDAAYRKRALDFVAGARAGNTPFGMELVARSGLGHPAEVIENYQYLFDQHTDESIGIDYYGTTFDLNEMIVLPRRDISRNEIQVVSITGNPTSGTFTLSYKGNPCSSLSWNVSALSVQEALENIVGIGSGNIQVSGGPAPNNNFRVEFVGPLAGQDVPTLSALSQLAGGTDTKITCSTQTSGNEAVDEIVNISAISKHHLVEAVDRIKPVTTLMTMQESAGLRSRQPWVATYATSERCDILRFVTGSSEILWPTVDDTYWIEKEIEKEAPRPVDTITHHYQGFHNVNGVRASTEHIGQFSSTNNLLFPALNNTDSDLVFRAERATADYAEPLTVTSTLSSTELINNIYPVQYANLPGVPPIKYLDDQFWASAEREGEEYLDVDLGRAVPVNYISFEVTRKPMNIAITYDPLNLGYDPANPPASPAPFLPVTLLTDQKFDSYIHYDPDLPPWQRVEFVFTNSLGQIPITRTIKITFTRDPSPTVYGGGPLSIDVRNLRVGRNI